MRCAYWGTRNLTDPRDETTARNYDDDGMKCLAGLCIPGRAGGVGSM